jgi:hypothetical protein
LFDGVFIFMDGMLVGCSVDGSGMPPSRKK